MSVSVKSSQVEMNDACPPLLVHSVREEEKRISTAFTFGF